MTPDVFDRLCRARDLLRDAPPRTVRQVAREAGMSPFHFIRQFEALFGVTPHQFRMQARLDRARVLLASGTKSVTGVCLDVGMESLGSFSDLFTRRVGASPSEYRRRACEEDVFPGCLSLMAGLPAFRNFREAPRADTRLECGNANQTHQSDGE